MTFSQRNKWHRCIKLFKGAVADWRIEWFIASRNWHQNSEHGQWLWGVLSWMCFLNGLWMYAFYFHRICLSLFLHLWDTCNLIRLKEDRFILTYGFRCFSPHLQAQTQKLHKGRTWCREKLFRSSSSRSQKSRHEKKSKKYYSWLHAIDSSLQTGPDTLVVHLGNTFTGKPLFPNPISVYMTVLGEISDSNHNRIQLCFCWTLINIFCLSLLEWLLLFAPKNHV